MYNWLSRFLIIFSLLIFSCKNNPYDVDVKDIKITPVQIERLDQDIFKITPQNINETVKSLDAKYGSFNTTYLVEMMNNGGQNDSSVKYNLLNFINDKNINDCKADVDKIFTEKAMKEISAALENPLKRLKYYFPEIPQPNIVSFISGWNYAAWYSDNTIGIGLDMYLGEKNQFYTMLGWPLYMTQKCDKKNIVPECIKAISISLVSKPEEMKDLLDNIIYKGKMQFMSDLLLPDMADSLKLNYTSKDMQYLEKYERNIWLFLTEKNRLFEQDPNEIIGYINDGPFTAAISKDCPPRIGIWVGRQIVSAYMQKNKVSVAQLLKETDSKKILQLAKYKP
jgi:hypothetical protein